MAKTKLTPELQEQILEHLKLGMYDTIAAEAVGISRQTFYRWIRRGKEEREGLYYDFAQAIEQGKAIGEADLLATIKRASNRTWQAAAWILERSRPERWALQKSKENAVEFWKKEILQLVKDKSVTFEDVVETVGEELAYELFDEAGIPVTRAGEAEEESSVEVRRETTKVSE